MEVHEKIQTNNGEIGLRTLRADDKACEGRSDNIRVKMRNICRKLKIVVDYDLSIYGSFFSTSKEIES